MSTAPHEEPSAPESTRSRLSVRPAVAGLVVIGLAAALATTWYLRHPPFWIGSSMRTTVVVADGGCDAHPPKLTHGKYWVQDSGFPPQWAVGSTHSGRLHFNSARHATFTTADGAHLRFLGLYPGWFNDNFPAVCLVSTG